ncbi:major head protein [uncultured Mediterranean phage uvMED]|jgi:hypothetical protein|nr:major head protein [uncultured Mediterranean phage uvMED]|tara:strand:+ start:724 stop:1662 length:939 start_codon:yes stop_codon:yes gene_type:complete
MAQISNTFSTYDAIGEREDLSDVIYNISPTDTPFMSAIAKTKATAVNHEWQLDSLAAASATNAAIEGDEVSFAAPDATVRKGNQCQISTKSVIVTGTLEAVNKAGRNSELAYQISKKSKELKRDMESSLTANNAPVTGNDSTAREIAGLGSWLKTNESASGTAPSTSGTNARSDGTQRAFTEAQLKTVIKSVWDNGGDPSMIMVGSFNKQKLSGFTGGSTRFDPAENKRLVAAVDVYESDFGAMQVTPNRFQRARDAFVITPDLFAVAFLRDFSLEDLAKTGDAAKQFLVTEYTLESRNEQGSGIVADLTTS